MPLTVITLRSVPPSLRGDLSKWMQEILTGVFVGNFNSKIREQLWRRVKESVSQGEATISYAYRNEIGYQFETVGGHRRVIDSDGIPLVLIPSEDNQGEKIETPQSDAARFHQARKYSSKKPVNTRTRTYIVLDIETDGLDEDKNAIIEIAALKVDNLNIETFHRLILYAGDLPDLIVKLTGIHVDELNNEGVDLIQALDDLAQFCCNHLIAGYNINFDMNFINNKYWKLSSKTLSNETVDLMRMVKKDKILLPNYKLQTVLDSYDIEQKVTHRALDDVRVTYELSLKLNEFQKIIRGG